MRVCLSSLAHLAQSARTPSQGAVLAVIVGVTAGVAGLLAGRRTRVREADAGPVGIDAETIAAARTIARKLTYGR